ncbi:MAG: ligase-associated DNA damage response endonuclease PdeM [Pseudomonadota bacterium]
MNTARTSTSDPAEINLDGVVLTALPSGALWWPSKRLLVVADLHLGRAERIARAGGTLLPPYETTETLDRLDAEIGQRNPRLVISLGDSFDDLAAARNLGEEIVTRLDRMAAGRRVIWIAGNHDPGPVNLPGTHLDHAVIDGVHFRHIAEPGRGDAEVSAHYHPKAQVTVKNRRISRRCFLLSGRRVILPAFGTYTGGLDVRDAAFDWLTEANARVLMTGKRIVGLPLSQLG